jgi:DNA-directed RNA polymerase subunit K/omega
VIYADPVFVAKERVPNRFLLCVVAFERSKQLIKGARPRTERRHHSPVTTALQEISEARIQPGAEGAPWKLA